MLREDIQYESSPIQYLHVVIRDGSLKLSLLGWREFLIEHNHLRSGVCAQRYQLRHLSGTNQGARIRPLQPLLKGSDHLQAGRIGKSLQLFHGVFQAPRRGLALDLDANQKRRLPGQLHLNCLLADVTCSLVNQNRNV
jgi:hypothetical protein